MDKNMTALVSCFSREYHYKNNRCRIFSDSYASKILTSEEYNSISYSMAKGITFFNPCFIGSDEEALRWVIDNSLSPSVLGRSAFCEKSLEVAIRLGCMQYLIYASGYDTYAYRCKYRNLKVFEIDKSDVIEDKKKRLTNNSVDISGVNYIECDFTDEDFIRNILNSNYDREKISFNSLLGISYYLDKKDFEEMIKSISSIIKDGSSIVFDYPSNEENISKDKIRKLAKGANEEMKAKYSFEELEKMLEKYNLYIYEHLNSQEMTNEYFSTYNTFNPNHKMKAPIGVNYCLLIKK